MNTKIRELYGLQIEEVTSDKLSTQLRKVMTQQKGIHNFEGLVHKGHQISEKVTYLQENLRLLEADQEHQVVTLRSMDPDQVKRNIEFFEMKIELSGKTTLERLGYSKETGEREPVDFVVSYETLERLSKDLR